MELVLSMSLPTESAVGRIFGWILKRRLRQIYLMLLPLLKPLLARLRQIYQMLLLLLLLLHARLRHLSTLFRAGSRCNFSKYTRWRYVLRSVVLPSPVPHLLDTARHAENPHARRYSYVRAALRSARYRATCTGNAITL